MTKHKQTINIPRMQLESMEAEIAALQNKKDVKIKVEIEFGDYDSEIVNRAFHGDVKYLRSEGVRTLAMALLKHLHRLYLGAKRILHL